MYSYRRTPLSVEVKKVMKMLMITLFIMVLTISFFFFMKMSGTAEKGSLVNENQLRQRSLESENRLLKEQVLEAQSLERIQTSDEVEKMYPAQGEIYLKQQGPVSRAGTKKIID